MGSTGIQRTIFFIAIFILVLILPWWLSVLLLFGLTVYIRFYPEVLFYGFLIDVLYSDRHTLFPYGLVFATILFLSIYFVRERIRT